MKEGTAVQVDGKPGVTVADSKGGWVAVQLAGERQWYEWPLSRVTVDPT